MRDVKVFEIREIVERIEPAIERFYAHQTQGSKLTSLRNGSRESISRQRREASQLGIVDIETARRLDKELSGARFVIRLKWRSTRHSRLIKPSIPTMVGGSSNSSDSNPESLQSGASDVIRGIARETHVIAGIVAIASKSCCVAWPIDTPFNSTKLSRMLTGASFVSKRI